MLNWKKIECTFCSTTVNGQQEWNDHYKTKKHQKRKSRYYKGLRGELSPQYLLA